MENAAVSNSNAAMHIASTRNIRKIKIKTHRQGEQLGDRI